jgi:hypothetical protein
MAFQPDAFQEDSFQSLILRIAVALSRVAYLSARRSVTVMAERSSSVIMGIRRKVSKL